MRELLDAGRFQTLFREHLLWDNPPDSLHQQPLEAMTAAPEVPVIGQCVAEKRGVMVWSIGLPEIPSRAEQHRKARELRQWSSDQLVVFAASTEQLWLWPEQRPSGTGWRLVDHHYRTGEGNDALLQRLDRVRFEIKEKLTGPQVLERVRQSFNVDKVTKRFYTEFKKYHQALTEQIRGIPAHRERDRRWYASVLMNRLMFIYFIQKKGFLGSDPNYLQNRLKQITEMSGGRDLNAYFGDLLLPLFHQGLGKHPSEQTWDPDICRIVGQVPYVDGGIFERHDLERDYEMEIPDSAFESLFDFFDRWRWHLDERPSGEHNEINPDILGFIFEQYVNYTEKGRKEKGAYYTKPDVTGYMSTSTIIPAVVDRLVDRGLEDPCVLLPGSKDRYLHSVLGYGREVDLPGGDLDPSKFPDPALDIALPGERWCDVTHRRDRYDELVALVDGGGVDNINDAVTANLDLVGLMEDYLSQMPADECEVAFEVLRSLTVCDPTCGSGAFLLSALDVLEPMYTVVLDRAREIADSIAGGPAGWSHVPQFLEEAEHHPSDRYWLLKTICLNNLYGMDIMGEATEIAKLRLFLKLVAQLDDVNQIEPLPDLDFNIKSGNLLVGIADLADADRRFSDDLLQLLGIKAAEQAAKKAADAYERFVKEQIADSGTGAVAGKQRLMAQIRAATTQADVALYEMRGETIGFETWMLSHVPFHWFAEFPSVWRDGGFDVVIGNPPYISKRQVTEYTWRGFRTEKCPDLYAVCVERASTLLNKSGRFAMIVMHSLCFHRGFAELRRWLPAQLPTLWISSYARIPDGLFSGSARVRNTIVLGHRGGQPGMLSSRCRRWLSKARHWLFPTQEYIRPDEVLLRCGDNPQWPFMDEPRVARAFEKMVRDSQPLDTVVNRTGEFELGYKTTAQYMLGVFVDEPPTIHPITGLPVGTASKRSGWLLFDRREQRDLALLCLAGRWGYLWWLMFGDEFDVTRTVLLALPCDIERLVAAATLGGADHHRPCDMELVSLVTGLYELASQLQVEMPKHIAWKANAGVKVGRYNMLKVRHITDEADWRLAQAWGLTREDYEAAGSLRDRMTFGNRG